MLSNSRLLIAYCQQALWLVSIAPNAVSHPLYAEGVIVQDGRGVCRAVLASGDTGTEGKSIDAWVLCGAHVW